MERISKTAAFYRRKKIFITGGTEGIGLAAALLFTEAGADVTVASRDAAKQTAALAQMEHFRGNSVQQLKAVALDVTDAQATQRVLETLVERDGTPDIVFNCAGFSQPGYLDDLGIDDLRRMMDVNYFGTVHTVKALLPALRRSGRGQIVNVSSMAGYLGLFGYTGYCASKYAVIGFSWALRHEVAPYGLSVSVLCPPNTRTPGLERENRTKPKEVLAMEEKTKTVSAEAVAHVLLRALPRRPFLIHPTWEARMIHFASRLLPTWAADSLLRRPT